MSAIIPHLWYDGKAEEAANFYVSLFKNSRILHTVRYTAASAKVSGQPEGAVMTVDFELDGQRFVALNGGPMFQFTPAVSFMVPCESQQEIDRLWEALSEGGEKERCGWLKDKYGVSWQIVPEGLDELLRDAGGERSERVMQAILTMDKLDMNTLLNA